MCVYVCVCVCVCLTLGESEDVLVDICGLCSLLHLLVASGDASVADVVPQAGIEQHRVLGHHPDVGAQRALLHLRRWTHTHTHARTHARTHAHTHARTRAHTHRDKNTELSSTA